MFKVFVFAVVVACAQAFAGAGLLATGSAIIGAHAAAIQSATE